jgi:hypothetical protein
LLTVTSFAACSCGVQMSAAVDEAAPDRWIVEFPRQHALMVCCHGLLLCCYGLFICRYGLRWCCNRLLTGFLPRPWSPWCAVAQQGKHSYWWPVCKMLLSGKIHQAVMRQSCLASVYSEAVTAWEALSSWQVAQISRSLKVSVEQPSRCQLCYLLNPGCASSSYL